MRFRKKAILEDSEFLSYAFAVCKRIGTVKEIYYKYSYHPKTTSESNTTNAVKYNRNITAAMQAIYEKLSPLENYSNIQDAVEYEIAQMYLYGIINCLQNKSQIGFDSEKNLKKLQEIAINSLRIPFAENRFITEKIKGDDLALLKKFEKI